MKKIELDSINYEVIEDHREGFNFEMLKERYTDFYHEYDYIVGDIAYNKLRLKGFYNENNKKVSELNNFKNVKDYIENHCAYGCKYFVIKKID